MVLRFFKPARWVEPTLFVVGVFTQAAIQVTARQLTKKSDLPSNEKPSATKGKTRRLPLR